MSKEQKSVSQEDKKTPKNPYREAWERELHWGHVLNKCAEGIGDGFRHYLGLIAERLHFDECLDPDSEFAKMVFSVRQFSDALETLIQYNDIVLCAHLEDREPVPDEMSIMKYRMADIRRHHLIDSGTDCPECSSGAVSVYKTFMKCRSCGWKQQMATPEPAKL